MPDTSCLPAATSEIVRPVAFLVQPCRFTATRTLATAFLALVAFGAGSAQTQELATMYPDSGEYEECYRPYLPTRGEYHVEQDYQDAMTAYYSQAQRYLTCLDLFVKEVRRQHEVTLHEVLEQYNRQFAEEVGSYIDERKSVMKELQMAVQQHANREMPLSE